ncbi:YopJ family acetyltransferase [Bradyrhizobium sp. CCBAU 53421]|uniref:YopJ family acetyltransferase n=1 Tax=Bradyrhizobium sp. CCBAU 53421 TaxID=1325120 RepID=UPI0018C0454D|nr:YopJ family acetyltransferase [Bradyrhizobium sp. CCBAU 53421]QOZ36577.1 hypothetical protein XH92_37455 [Bradyrhizobium sp. CCBAU 53421]
MGGCISRLSARRETSQDDGQTQEADFAVQLDSVRSASPRSIDEPEHAAGPSREADLGTTSQPIRPARIDEKLQLLEQTLERASEEGVSSGLVDYGQQVARNLAANIQTDEKLLSLDVDNIDRLADSYNERYPDLNLRYMGSPANFLEALTDRSSTGGWRAIVRLADGEAHHFAADIRTRAGAAPTVIVMEPADLYTFIAPYSRLRGETLQQLGPEPKWAFIGVGVQKSASDCVMFSMQCALAARQNSSTFDDWHNNLRRHGTIADERDISSDYMASPDAILEFAQINLFHGEKVLPALFYKHAHSTRVIEEAAGNRAGFRDEDVSTSSRAPKTESLAERREAFAVQRGTLKYSASIETSRATKIRRALDGMLSD